MLRKIHFLLTLAPFFVILCEGHSKHTREEATDGALFLTPYIESGRIAEAQRLAKVRPLLNTPLSFSGYLTVNKSFNSNLFFWLVTSQQAKWEDRPIVFWLQGGFAETSLYGFFRSFGPFFVMKNHKLKRRKYTWSRKYNVIFIDHPVGAGFSFTENQSGYATSVFDAMDNLYGALIQIYKLFPALRDNQLVVAGESTGSVFALAFAHKIYEMNKISPFKVPLRKLILSSNIVEAASSFKNYGQYLFKLGLMDKQQERKLSQQEDEFQSTLKTGNYDTVVQRWNETMSYISEVTGLKSWIDYVHDETEPDLKPATTWFLDQPEFRRKLHLGNRKMSDGGVVKVHLKGDYFRSEKKLLEELLEAEVFPILCVNGQLDTTTPYWDSVEFYNSLEWSHASEYHRAKRCQFKSGGQVAGYYKTAGTLTEVMIRNSNHLIASAKPKWAFEVLDKFITNSSFYECS